MSTVLARHRVAPSVSTMTFGHVCNTHVQQVLVYLLVAFDTSSPELGRSVTQNLVITYDFAHLFTILVWQHDL